MQVLSNTTYDLFQRFVRLVLPAIGTLYFTVAEIWDLPYGAQVVATVTAIALFLGVLLTWASSSFEPPTDGDILIQPNGDGTSTLHLAPNEEPSGLLRSRTATFAVVEAPR